MDFLKKLFPMSFKKSSEVADLVKRIVIYVVALIVASVAMSLIGLAGIPALNIILGLIGWLVDIYCTAGVVLAILVHCNVIKLGDGNDNTEA